MSNYKIKVHIEIVESEESTQSEPQAGEAGRIEFTIGAAQAESIDECEQALLRANYPALRAALAEHFAAVSKKKALEQLTVSADGEVQTRPGGYRVEGEVGRFCFDSHRLICGEQVVYDTAGAVFRPLQVKEWYRTMGYQELALVHGTIEGSYRKTCGWLNRLRHQPGATPLRTLQDSCEREGQRLQAQWQQQAETILHDHGFTPEGQAPPTQGYGEQTAASLPEAQVAAAVRACAPEPEWEAPMQANGVPYEVSAQACHLAIDDIQVKSQKPHRQPEATKDKKYVHNTVAHLDHGAGRYRLVGQGVANVLKLVIAFLLHNDLLQHKLMVFVDGQKTLQAAVFKALAWFAPLQLILDWYHLKQKCTRQLSMALNGRQLCDEIRPQLLHFLWHGLPERAIAFLQTLDPAQIKNAEQLQVLIDYIDRHQPYLPCYAVRKYLGLRNGSQRGEKANDLLVAERQKHNGMSWSEAGSLALASLTSLVLNHEYRQWFKSGTLSFKLVAVT